MQMLRRFLRILRKKKTQNGEQIQLFSFKKLRIGPTVVLKVWTAVKYPVKVGLKSLT